MSLQVCGWWLPNLALLFISVSQALVAECWFKTLKIHFLILMSSWIWPLAPCPAKPSYGLTVINTSTPSAIHLEERTPGLGGYFDPGPWKGKWGNTISVMSLFVHKVLFCSLLSSFTALMETVVNLIEIKSQARRGCNKIIQKQKVGQKYRVSVFLHWKWKIFILNHCHERPKQCCLSLCL